jgi:hypothetical protein
MSYKHLDEELKEIDFGNLASAFFCGPIEVDPIDFVDPTDPWMFDKDAWLPSVPKLHTIIRSAYIECTIPYHIHYLLIMNMYGVLSKEYYQRLEQASNRITEEQNAMLYSCGAFC